MKIVKQWKQDEKGVTAEDKSCLVISLGNEKTIVIHWKPFSIRYNKFCGC